MKAFLSLIFLYLLNINTFPQSLNPDYDSTIAKNFDGDDYGMKWYVMVILKTGSNNIEVKTIRDSLFDGHFSNMKRLSDEGLLIAAGPIAKNEKNYRGIFILNVSTVEEAEDLILTDPAIKEKVLEGELYRWYGSAALPVYIDTHKKIQKLNIQ